MLRKLFSHTAIYGLAPHVSKIASFFVLPIITQYLTPTDYGVYGVVTATVGSISVFASLGLRVVLVNSFYKSPGHYKWLWRQVYGFLSLWVIPYAFISAALVYFIIPEEAKPHVWQIIFINVAPLVFFWTDKHPGHHLLSDKQKTHADSDPHGDFWNAYRVDEPVHHCRFKTRIHGLVLVHVCRGHADQCFLLDTP
ncbi:MAG TPA: oligosaccharide flippase family protein [Chryseolinea sp.]